MNRRVIILIIAYLTRLVNCSSRHLVIYIAVKETVRATCVGRRERSIVMWAATVHICRYRSVHASR